MSYILTKNYIHVVQTDEKHIHQSYNDVQSRSLKFAYNPTTKANLQRVLKFRHISYNIYNR